MTSPDVTRKVRQLDNDVQAIYEMLAKIEATQTRHGNRLAELTESVTELTDSVTEMDGKLGGMDGKLSGMDGKLGEMGRTLNDMDGKLDSIVVLLERR